MINPAAASMRNVLRQPKASVNCVKGVCATIAPSIAKVTINPTISAMCFAGNQREARRTQLNKQNEPPAPVIKRHNSACHSAVVNENKKAQVTHKNMAMPIMRRVEKRSKIIPAGNKNKTMAYM